MGQLVAPGNIGESLIPIGQIPTVKPELAPNPGPVPPRVGIVLALRDSQLRQHAVPLFHARRAQPSGRFRRTCRCREGAVTLLLRAV